MKLNKEKFMKTEMGGELEETIRTWDKAIDERRKATPETMEKIIADGVVKRGWDGCVYLCEKPQDAAKFVAIRGHDEVAVIEVILPANKVKESFDHSVQFFQCKAFMYEEDIKVRPNAEVVEYSFK